MGESVHKPLEYYRNNLDSTLTLCETMRRYGCKRIVFSSSATVYGVPDEVPLREDMFCKGCTNPYGWTKYMIEKILQGIVTADPEWSVVLLRYFNPIGAHESGRMGENPNGIPNNLMPYITKVAAGQLDHLTVFGNDYNTPDGTGVRDYIHVVDLAKGHVAACDYAAKHNGCEIINLGTGVGYSVLDIVNTFSRVNQVPVPYVIGPRRDGDVDACYADPTKAKELLGWTATKTLEDMCRDSWRWQKSEPERLSGQMSNGARQFPETGDFAPFCANRFCADGLFYFHVELFRCAGESPLRRRPKGMKTNRSLRLPFGNLRRGEIPA